MSERTDYQQALSDALNNRGTWLEKSQVGALKEKLRAFHTAYSSLYALLLKKGLIKEDPYKNEVRVQEIHIPETGAFSSDNVGELSIRLANYDNQLDFLVNFYPFKVDSFNLGQIKNILDLIKYIDWVHLSATSQFPNTAAVTDLINRMRGGNDAVSTTVLNGIIVTLFKFTKLIVGDLKVFADFSREVYKLDLREVINEGVPQKGIPSVYEIKKKFVLARPGQSFYPELVEELLKEDYSEEGPALRENILKSLGIPDNKPKAPKQEISPKSILIEGIKALSSTAATFSQIELKFDENGILLENRRIGFLGKLKRIMDQVLNKDAKPVIYELEYPNAANSGPPIKEKLNFSNLQEDIHQKAKNLAALGLRKVEKLEAMPDDQLTGFLERTIKDIRSMYRILTATDAYFKTMVDEEDRNKVKGIKPELSTIKNAFLKASQKCAEYTDMKGEKTQFNQMDNSAG